MSKFITVNCTIGRSGRVWIHRIKLDDAWLPVEQGRQWQDEDGRHVLVMPPNGKIEELLLSAGSLCWELAPRPSGLQII